jgi:MraZ protein
VPESVLPKGFVPLIGTEDSTLDEKGRLLFSKKKRERLGDDFVILLGKLNCLILYPGAIWKLLIADALRGPVMDPAREDFTRLLLGTASDGLSFDGQNRIVIPKELRKEAKLQEGDRVNIVGCGDRVEVWARDEWVKFRFKPDDYEKERREVYDRLYDTLVWRSPQGEHQ